jgi:UDP-N-acetylglucosamine 2-epimerase (non-hydrolysing)/GDP/UDP-N,N'-diacetylbacillosamine 2-epimerase (hydrolysing)
VATALRIPIAHIEGGEISEGAIDDAVRHALTKLSHVHFTSTERARERVIAMGEESWRVHCAGAPSLDHLRRSALLSREEVEARLGVQIEHPTVVVAYHPTTIAQNTIREADAVFTALESLPGQLLFCYPNADAGSRELINRASGFVRTHPGSHLFVSLEPVVYWSLLSLVDLLTGNSSSGIMEAASFALPAVNIGIRQRGRERGRNVLDAEASATSILDRFSVAQSAEFRQSLQGMENPYGDGRASERIASVLAAVPLGEELLIKRGAA